ncbi:hypothetical protein E2C01_071392 [Portunus trituberculatus]|uniref:Uncharacterized protein n=1 Tax=Portunus trituberculatus TaxID=210409 RepID=A0A5B7I4C2_PORTR|nr:hypothetical protein [Portunus trituberculatus]
MEFLPSLSLSLSLCDILLKIFHVEVNSSGTERDATWSLSGHGTGNSWLGDGDEEMSRLLMGKCRCDARCIKYRFQANGFEGNNGKAGGSELEEIIVPVSVKV